MSPNNRFESVVSVPRAAQHGVEAVGKPQIGTNLLKKLAEAKSKMGMEIPMKARQSLHGKDLKTLPKEVKHIGSFIVLYRI